MATSTADQQIPKSFCQTYNNCVQTKYSQQCWKHHVKWLEYTIIELDCNLGCKSVEGGEGFGGEEMVFGVGSGGGGRGFLLPASVQELLV